jgi:hypothetical protein
MRSAPLDRSTARVLTRETVEWGPLVLPLKSWQR